MHELRCLFSAIVWRLFSEKNTSVEYCQTNKVLKYIYLQACHRNDGDQR